MSRRAFLDDGDDQGDFLPPARQPHPLACRAHGCYMPGSASVEGSNLLCIAHRRAPTSQWDGITFQLRKHEWLAKLPERISAFATDALWVSFATDFWRRQGDEHMLPGASERTRRGLYEQRLRDELLYRVGLTQVRPKPREIQPWGPRTMSTPGFARAHLAAGDDQ